MEEKFISWYKLIFPLASHVFINIYNLLIYIKNIITIMSTYENMNSAILKIHEKLANNRTITIKINWIDTEINKILNCITLNDNENKIHILSTNNSVSITDGKSELYKISEWKSDSYSHPKQYYGPKLITDITVQLEESLSEVQ